jgi:hypothetical protein
MSNKLDKLKKQFESAIEKLSDVLAQEKNEYIKGLSHPAIRIYL